MVIFYLHGFASSSLSNKATYLGERLRAKGIEFHAPDLNLPDFSTLTVTRMLEQTHARCDRRRRRAPVTLIGSSLGGFVAVQRGAAVAGPGRQAGAARAGARLRRQRDSRGRAGRTCQWKAAGYLHVFHFGYGRMLRVHYELYADARRYDAMNAHLSSRSSSSRAAATPPSIPPRSKPGRAAGRTSSCTCSTTTTSCIASLD